MAIVSTLAFMVAAASGVPQTMPEAAQPAAPDKKICHPIQVTGSIMPGKRLCMTRSEWVAYDQKNNAAYESARNSRNRSWGRSPATE